MNALYAFLNLGHGVLAAALGGGAGSAAGGAGNTIGNNTTVAEASFLTSAIVWLPLFGALVILFLPNRNDEDGGRIKSFAAMITGIDLVLAIVAYITSSNAISDFSWSSGLRYEEQYKWWLGNIGASYHVGLDGISLPMVVLSALLFFVAVLASWNIRKRVKEYFFLVLLMQVGVTGVFTAADYLLFFIFWEIELIPMFLLILVWGGARRVYAAWKFLLFTITASAFLLMAILVMYFRSGLHTFDMAGMTQAVFPSGVAAVIFFLFFACFAIKLPAWPLHTWLPDAHVEAPTAMSVLLAGILLKMGGYGIIRICVNQFPQTARQYSLAILLIGVVGVIWGGFAALRQDDMKRLVAYSSVSHMGFVLVGVSALTPISLGGAVFQLFAHGVITGSLFLLVGLVYDRTHTRSIRELGGLAEKMPYLTVAWVVAAFAAVGLPGFVGFIAEFEIFVGSYGAHHVGTFLAVFGVVLSAGYMLWMLQRVFFGPLKEQWQKLKDPGMFEGGYMVVMLAVIFFLGVAPGILQTVINFGITPITARLGSG